MHSIGSAFPKYCIRMYFDYKTIENSRSFLDSDVNANSFSTELHGVISSRSAGDTPIFSVFLVDLK